MTRLEAQLIVWLAIALTILSMGSIVSADYPYATDDRLGWAVVEKGGQPTIHFVVPFARTNLPVSRLFDSRVELRSPLNGRVHTVYFVPHAEPAPMLTGSIEIESVEGIQAAIPIRVVNEAGVWDGELPVVDSSKAPNASMSWLSQDELTAWRAHSANMSWRWSLSPGAQIEAEKAMFARPPRTTVEMLAVKWTPRKRHSPLHFNSFQVLCGPGSTIPKRLSYRRAPNGSLESISCEVSHLGAPTRPTLIWLALLVDGVLVEQLTTQVDGWFKPISSDRRKQLFMEAELAERNKTK